jgi:SAM-dependent methyltransferase
MERDACVLDAGCGTGGLILNLQKRFPRWRWSGIDFSALACEMAQRRTGADIREASITKLPFAEGQFDGIATADVICQVENPDAATAELFRALRPGGVAVINLPAYQWMWSYHDEAVQNLRRYTRAELKALLSEAGFVDVRLTYWNSLLFPMIFVQRKFFPQKPGTSDVKSFPAPVEAFFRGVTSIELAWLAIGGRLAWGLSVLASARKP